MTRTLCKAAQSCAKNWYENNNHLSQVTYGSITIIIPPSCSYHAHTHTHTHIHNTDWPFHYSLFPAQGRKQTHANTYSHVYKGCIGRWEGHVFLPLADPSPSWSYHRYRVMYFIQTATIGLMQLQYQSHQASPPYPYKMAVGIKI